MNITSGADIIAIIILIALAIAIIVTCYIGFTGVPQRK